MLFISKALLGQLERTKQQAAVGLSRVRPPLRHLNARRRNLSHSRPVRPEVTAPTAPGGAGPVKEPTGPTGSMKLAPARFHSRCRGVPCGAPGANAANPA